MSAIQSIILGIIQGLTEFIPVSSSAHLALVPWALGWPQQGLFFDTMVHWGTLLAVIVYFWDDWVRVVRSFVRSLTVRGPWSSAPGGRLADPDARLAWGIGLATIPAAAVGYFFDDFVEGLFNKPPFIGVALLVTALVLALSERLGRRERPLDALGLPDAVTIGLAQALAVVPGLSRSGATIAAGLSRGLTREAAARFSFLLSAPIIFGAGFQQLVKVVSSPVKAAEPLTLAAGFVASAVAGYLCIRFLLNYLQKGRLYVFAAYCAVVGIATLVASTLLL